MFPIILIKVNWSLISIPLKNVTKLTINSHSTHSLDIRCYGWTVFTFKCIALVENESMANFRESAYSKAELIRFRLRLPRHLLLRSCSTLEPELRRSTRRSRPTPEHGQVLSVLSCSTGAGTGQWEHTAVALLGNSSSCADLILATARLEPPTAWVPVMQLRT